MNQVRVKKSAPNANLDLIQQLSKSAHQSIIEETCLSPEKETQFYLRFKKEPLAFFKDPLQTYFGFRETDTGQEQVSELSLKFCSTDEKNQTIDVLSNALSQSLRSEVLRSDVMIIADELITNALFNAPFQDKSGKKLEEIERGGNSISMPPGFSANLLLGYDEDRVMIACQDFFGTLNPDQMIERIYQCYVNGVDQTINWGPGGAGIGSFMIFHNSSTMILAVQPGITTVVAAVIPRKMSQRKRAELGKAVHIIKENGDV